MAPQSLGENPIFVRECPVRALSADTIAQWEDLETRALEGNAFLSPHFVLPALRNLPAEADKDPIALVVESGDGRRLMGLGIFETCRGTRLLPLRHLRAWQSTHSFLDGVLLDRDSAPEVATAFFQWLGEQGDRWHGLSFRDRSADSEISAVLESAAARVGLAWHEDYRVERAAVPTRLVPTDCLGTLYKKRREGDWRRRLRVLESFGSVGFALDRCETGHKSPLDTFLTLEAMGWRGEQGSALISHPGHERFAREMVAGFAGAGAAVFPTLSVDGDPVAIGLCFRSGEVLFTFKSGWDTRLHRASPGVLLELNLMQNLGDLRGVEMMDSCSVPGSWMEVVWPWRRPLTTGVFTSTRIGSLLAGTALNLKRVKRRVGGALK